MKVEIKCDTENAVSLNDLQYFEKDIKIRNGYDIKRMKQSIEKSGFICPLFIWKKDGKGFVLDGKTRVMALLQMAEEGWKVSDIPVVYIEAKTESEAKEKVLQVNSRYGKITEASFDFFVKDANLQKSDFNIHFDTIHFENIDPYYEKRKEVKEDITRVIREGTPPSEMVAPKSNAIQQSLEKHYEGETTEDDVIDVDFTEDDKLEFSFGGGEVPQEIGVCCPYCYNEFKLSLDECIYLIGGLEAGGFKE